MEEILYATSNSLPKCLPSSYHLSCSSRRHSPPLLQLMCRSSDYFRTFEIGEERKATTVTTYLNLERLKEYKQGGRDDNNSVQSLSNR